MLVNITGPVPLKPRRIDFTDDTMPCDWECREYRERVEAKLTEQRQEIANLTIERDSLVERNRDLEVQLLNVNMMLNRSIGIDSGITGES